MEIHEQFVLEEDQLVKHIKTCNEITATILNLMYKEAQSLHTLTVEEVLMSVHRIQQDLQTEITAYSYRKDGCSIQVQSRDPTPNNRMSI